MKLHLISAAFLQNSYRHTFYIYLPKEKKHMKRNFILFFLMLGVGLSAFSQKVLNEGSLVYKISIENSKGEQQVAGALNNAVLTVNFNKDKSRTELVSKAGSEVTVYDNKAEKGFLLREYSGQKLMITMTDANWEQKNKTNNSLAFTTESGTSVINGYTVKKATAVSDGKTYTVYYDPSVIISNKTYNNAFPQLAGLPVEFELQSGNLVFKYSLIKYGAENFMPNEFDAPKSGYRVMTYDENQQLKKGDK